MRRQATTTLAGRRDARRHSTELFGNCEWLVDTRRPSRSELRSACIAVSCVPSSPVVMTKERSAHIVTGFEPE